MAFIISKISKFGDKVRKLYYLVENYREGNNVRRRAIVGLGENTNLSEALQCIQEKEEAVLLKSSELENRLERVKKGDLSAFYPFCPPYRQVTRITEHIYELKNELEGYKNDKAKIEVLIKQYPRCSAKET